MKFHLSRHWLELANQWLEVTRQFLWLDSDSNRPSHDSTLTRKNFWWLWLEGLVTLTRLSLDENALGTSPPCTNVSVAPQNTLTPFFELISQIISCVILDRMLSRHLKNSMHWWTMRYEVWSSLLQQKCTLLINTMSSLKTKLIVCSSKERIIFLHDKDFEVVTISSNAIRSSVKAQQ